MERPDDRALGLASYGLTAALFLEAVRSVVPHLQPHAVESLVIAPLSGGMSNLLFTVSVPGRADTTVVARLLSPALDAIIDRDTELTIFQQLAASGVAPLIFGVVHIKVPIAPGSVCIRVEQMIHGRTLTVLDFRDPTRDTRAFKLAHHVARLHAQAPPFADATSVFTEHGRRYLAMIAGMDHLLEPSEPLRELVHCLDWRAEVEFVSNVLAESGGPVVLGHTDLQPGNWILSNAALTITDLGADVSTSSEADIAVATAARSSQRSPYSNRVRREGSGLDIAPISRGDSLSFLAPARATKPAAALAPAADAKQEHNRLYIIDYEYAGVQLRGVDTGNLLCEHTFNYAHPVAPGFTMSVQCYPSLSWQREFFVSYAVECLLAGTEAEAAVIAPGTGGLSSASILRSELLEMQKRLPLTGFPAASSGADEDLVEGKEVGGDGELWLRTSASEAALARLRFDAPISLAPEATSEAGAPPGVASPCAGSARVLPESVRALAARAAAEARVGMLASHLYWALWGCVMAGGRAAGSAPPPLPLPRDAAASDSTTLPTGGTGTCEASGAGGGGSGSSCCPAVACGHGLFSYAQYGLDRAAEYGRLKRQLVADRAAHDASYT